jgi:hypothetical protein
VVGHRVREEEEHVHRYMVALEAGPIIPSMFFRDLTGAMIL